MKFHLRTRASIPFLALMTLTLLIPSTSFSGETVQEALKEGKAEIDLRVRYEGVNETGFSEYAEALTARLRLGFRTGKYNGFSAFAELEDVSSLGREEFNSTANGNTQYPVVADPIGTELNQAYMDFTGIKNTTVRLGRQRITLDDHRFVGNVGWRQNEQTYDGLAVVSQLNEKWRLILAHVNNVNRIFGEYNPSPLRADINTNAQFVNLAYKASFAEIVGYAHFIELQEIPLAGASHKNFGLRIKGGKKVADKTKILFLGEFADQSAFRRGADTIDATFTHLMLGVESGILTVKLDLEILGSNNGLYGFATPLATLHAFNGWTDKFLNTPANGLRDLYGSAFVKAGKWKLGGVYHRFTSDYDNIDYGSELGILIVRPFGDGFTFLTKYADYKAEMFSTDTSKLWVSLQFKL